MVKHGLIPYETGHLCEEVLGKAQSRPKPPPTFLPTLEVDLRGGFFISRQPADPMTAAGRWCRRRRPNSLNRLTSKFNLVYE